MLVIMVTGVSLEKLLEQFGAFFFITCKKSGHSNILRTLGHNLYGFLLNLDTLHDHLSFTYTQMRAPSFRCEKTGDGLTLHYHSYRPGLSNIVLGIVNAVAKDFYQLDISIEQVSYEETSDKLPHHYVFSIEVLESAKNDNYLERKYLYICTHAQLVAIAIHTVNWQTSVTFCLLHRRLALITFLIWKQLCQLSVIR